MTPDLAAALAAQQLAHVLEGMKLNLTRAVEQLEDLPHGDERLRRGQLVSGALEAAQDWIDGKPWPSGGGWLGRQAIRIAGGWDSRQDLARRAMVARNETVRALGRSLAGPVATPPPATLLDQVAGYWLYGDPSPEGSAGLAGAAKEGAGEGLREGWDDLRNKFDVAKQAGPYVAAALGVVVLLVVLLKVL